MFLFEEKSELRFGGEDHESQLAAGADIELHSARPVVL